MSNPWTKKNPFMSMWLSSANKVAGAARSQGTAAVKRELSSAQADAARQVVEFWTGKASPKPSKKK